MTYALRLVDGPVQMVGIRSDARLLFLNSVSIIETKYGYRFMRKFPSAQHKQ